MECKSCSRKFGRAKKYCSVCGKALTPVVQSQSTASSGDILDAFVAWLPLVAVLIGGGVLFSGHYATGRIICVAAAFWGLNSESGAAKVLTVVACLAIVILQLATM